MFTVSTIAHSIPGMYRSCLTLKVFSHFNQFNVYNAILLKTFKKIIFFCEQKQVSKFEKF